MYKLETMQAKILKTIVNAPWYVRNEDKRRDLGISTVKEAVSNNTERCKARIATHPNRLAAITFNTFFEMVTTSRKTPHLVFLVFSSAEAIDKRIAGRQTIKSRQATLASGFSVTREHC